MSHVALLIPGLDRVGGAERQVMLLAKGLCRRGWRVSVVALSGSGGPAAGVLTDAGVSFLSLKMRKGLADPRGWIRFQRWLRRERPDVVHAHLPHAAWFARWSRLAASIPVLPAEPIPVLIDTLHSTATGGVGRWIGYRLSRGLPDCVTAVSQAAAESHIQAGMARRERTQVLPNGIDVDAWRPENRVRSTVRRELGLNDGFLWLAAGRLEPVKDYSTLLQAMTGMPAPARLLIAGCGSLKTELAALSARLGLEGRVRFLGFLPDLRRLMQAADGFVLSSLWEGLPMSLLEAAACGLPVVATDVPGTHEAVADGVTGRLIPGGDPAALSAAMAAMMRLPVAECRAIGDRARLRVTERFGLESVLDRWERLYREAAKKPVLEHFRQECLQGK